MAFIAAGGRLLQATSQRSDYFGQRCAPWATNVATRVRYASRRFALPARMQEGSPQAKSSGESATLKQFLTDARELGTIRFIAVSGGAVIETVGRFDYGIQEFSVPGKGDYLTLASIDKTFECHISENKVVSITLTSEPAKIGGHEMHVIRFKAQDDSIVLSCALMWDPSQGPGNYLHGAVNAFKELKAKYGEQVEVSPRKKQVA